jgi:hypothetical protein
MKRLITSTSIALLFAALPFATLAQTHSAAQEIKTAHTHAKLASRASSVKMTHTHLHHVINCLVGAQGSDFYAKAGNPCEGMGNGALPDSANQSKLHKQLKHALNVAKSGEQASQLKAAHQSASKAATLLKKAAASAKSR